MKKALLTACVVLLADGAFSPARADLTAFVGTTTTPTSRLARGLAIGIGLVIVGFEFEYSDAKEDATEGVPGLRTGMGNIYVQTPIPVSGLQFYGTVGGGLYRERLGVRQETHVGTNLGGGVKISLAGPLRVRLDYRLFRLRGSPRDDHAHRVYAGLNIAF